MVQDGAEKEDFVKEKLEGKMGPAISEQGRPPNPEEAQMVGREKPEIHAVQRMFLWLSLLGESEGLNALSCDS